MPSPNAWDRESTAEFLSRNADLVLARIRRELGPGTRRHFDSQDMLSTVQRRVDDAVRRGVVRADTSSAMLAFVFAVVRTAVIDKSRVASRLHRLGMTGPMESNDAVSLSNGARDTEESLAAQLISLTTQIEDPKDQDLLLLRLNGHSLREISESSGEAHEAVRGRWRRLVARLRHMTVAEVA